VPRRSIYAMIDRQNLPSLFRTFDFASPDAHSPHRYFTTVPQQALYLLNSKQATELAGRVAKQVRSRVSSDAPHLLMTETFRQVLGREPNPRERQMAESFVADDAMPATASIDMRSLWVYGTGEVDDASKVQSFVRFPVFKDGRWQAGGKFPMDSPMGHAMLGKDTGHPGNTNAQSVIRRWRAPASGRVRIIGMVGHRGDHGDGIQAAIWVGGKRVFRETQKMNNRPYGPLAANVVEGEFVDFVAAPGTSSSFDSFFWRIQIKLVSQDGRIFESDSTKDFSGPFDPESVNTLSRLAQLAHALLMSNEFAFVD
ncbi:MAG: DUF1553 domain-containing protein, partial [Pirellulaceae bacterium]|nr:DUF1553 domain-containing protein [Pirellulaceae bacterium]